MKILEALGKSARTLIALSVVLMSFGFLFALVYHAVPEQNKDIIQIASGLVLAVLAGVTGYYFGSSKDKSDQEKADIIQKTNDTKN